MIAPLAGARLRLICLVTHTNPGGAQQALSRLSDELRRRGHTVDVWSLYGRPSDEGRVTYGRIVLPQREPGVSGYLRIVWRLARALRAADPDAVISFLPLACIAGQFAAWVAGVPSRVASQRNPHWTYQPLMQLCDRIAGSAGLYTRNVANSESVRESFAGYPNAYLRRLTVVHNGLAWCPSSLSRAAARAKFALPVDVPVIVNVARLSVQKNQPFLLRVLERLPHAHLAIAGDGELGDALRTEATRLGIAGRVHFLGRLDQPAIADLLAAADLFAQPSLFEGQSNALLEAMNAGVPVVASDIPPQVETLCGADGESVGRLLPVDDAAAWVREIGNLLRDPGLRQRLAARASERAAAFTIGRMADGFERAITWSAAPRSGLPDVAPERGSRWRVR